MHNLQVPIPRQDVSAPQKRRISSLFTERFCSSLARVDANTQLIARTYGANFRPFPKSAAAGSWWRALTPAWERTTAAAWERTVTQWCVDEWWAWAKWLQLGRPSRSIWQPIPAAWKEVKSWIGVELREDYLDRTLCTPSTASERTVIKTVRWFSSALSRAVCTQTGLAMRLYLWNRYLLSFKRRFSSHRSFPRTEERP